MAQDNNAAQQIFDTIVTRDFDPKALNAMGKPTVNAADADLISFNFKTENKDYGTVVILIDGEDKIEVYYGDSIGRTMERDDRGDWYDFLAVIRNIAKRNLYTFSLNNMNRLKYSMKSMAQLAEGWNGTNKTSYNKQGPAKLIIKHSRKLGEGEARFRNIESLFVENSQGERFKMPFRSISGGKAMARHVTEGGNPYDQIGQHISDTVNEIATLSKFIRATKSKSFGQNVDAVSIAEDAVRHYKDLKRKAKKMISRKGYKDIFASWDPMEITDLDETIDKVREVFSTNTLDSRIEEALPILAKIKETNMKEADVFEQWADSITEGTWALPDTPEQMAELAELMKEPLHCGPAGEFATEQLYGLIGDDELFDDIYEMGLDNPDADCRPLVLARLKEFNIELGENAPMTSLRPMARPSSMRPQARPLSNLGGTREIAPNGEPTGSTRGFKPLGEAMPYAGNSPQYKGVRIPTDDTVDAKDITKKATQVDMPGGTIDDFDFSGVDGAKLKKVLAAQLDAIDDVKIKKVIQARFGIGPFKKEYTLQQVASAMGVTPEVIRQRESKGLRMLKHPSRARELRPFMSEAQLTEMAPLVAAAVWVLKFVAARGAWPVLKWLLKKHAGKIAAGATGAYYMDQGWDWVKSAIGEEYAQMLIDNKFEIGAAVALVLGAVALKKLIEKQGEKFISANESINEDPTQEEPLTKANQQDLDDEDMTEVTDIDTGKPALKAERDPMIESELDRLLTLARG